MKLISASDLSRAQIEVLFARADEIANGASPKLENTRVTLALFNTAFPLPIAVENTLRSAGAQIISAASPETVPAADARLILYSSPESDSARDMALKTRASVLNAGDGVNENPVRALMDAYTIRSLKGDLENNRTAILGNAKFGAEAHSLARLLGTFHARISVITTAALSMPYDLTDEVRATAYEVEETNDLLTTLRKTDVLYLANIDSIRVEKKIYDKQKDYYSLTPETFSEAKPGLVLLGEWDGAENLLAPMRPQIERASRAMLLALIESAID